MKASIKNKVYGIIGIFVIFGFILVMNYTLLLGNDDLDGLHFSNQSTSTSDNQVTLKELVALTTSGHVKYTQLEPFEEVSLFWSIFYTLIFVALILLAFLDYVLGYLGLTYKEFFRNVFSKSTNTTTEGE